MVKIGLYSGLSSEYILTGYNLIESNENIRVKTLQINIIGIL